MRRRRFLKLAFGILAGATGALLSVQIVLADSLVPSPTHGQAIDPVTFTFAAPIPPTGGCSPNTLITFWWDVESPSTQIGIVPLTIDPNNRQQCIAALTNFVPAKSPNAKASVGVHLVVAGQKTTSARTQYTIDNPPSPPPTTPPPSTPPTPPPPPPTTPPATTPPATTPPARTPPASTPPANPPPVNSPPASPSPSPEACKAVAASIAQPGPGGLGGGLALVLVLSGALPITGLMIRRRRLGNLAVLLALAGLVVGAMACGGAPNLESAADPTPSNSVPAEPTTSCYQDR